MFNVKALWWTLLAVWILGATYWHVCEIRQLCDGFHNAQLFLTEVVPPSGAPGNFSIVAYHQMSMNEIWQYSIMFLGVVVLGFFTGRSYEGKKTRELRYKLNRINRELKYYQSRT